MEMCASEKEGAGARIDERVAAQQADSDPVNSATLFPLCDVAGYACFVTWAFAVGWDCGLAPFGEEIDFSILRCALFVGVALATCLLFVAGGGGGVREHVRTWKAVSLIACTAVAASFFIPLPPVVLVLFWLIGGCGQAVAFFLWGERLRILSRRQQIYAICGAFVIGGVTLLLIPFVDAFIVAATIALLPFASLVLLFFAGRQFRSDEARDGISHVAFPCGAASIKQQIPFADDRQFVVLKGLFALLYSIPLGFVACAVLTEAMYPGNSVAIGLGNVVPALMVAVLLRDREKAACKAVPKLFFPVTCFCFFFFAGFWPSAGVLVCAFVLFVLFGIYEILGSYTAYVSSAYDAVKCLWELSFSKAGNAVGFAIGWAAAIAGLLLWHFDTSMLTLFCFGLVSFVALADTVLFKGMKFELYAESEEAAPEAPSEINHAEAEGTDSMNQGRWTRTCEELSNRYGLSPRQREIFLLLAKGRNATFIKDKFVLSATTVKSHIYSIYQKMGVHSHQELLDLVEEALREA